MPGTIIETHRSREATEGENPKAEHRYVVIGESDDVQVRALVLTTAPSVYLGLRRTNYTITPLDGGNDWDVSVLYQKRSDSQYAFDTSGGTANIKQSLATVGTYVPAGETAADYEGAIEVSGDSVNGTDIVVPVFSFSETHYFDDATISAAYKLIVFNLTGKVNNAPFKGFAKGECLFLGCQGQKQGQGDWELQYRFSASPNVSMLTVGGGITINKEGWQYAWTVFDDDVDNAAKRLIKKPVQTNVDQVYSYGDLAGLGIGS